MPLRALALLLALVLLPVVPASAAGAAGSGPPASASASASAAAKAKGKKQPAKAKKKQAKAKAKRKAKRVAAEPAVLDVPVSFTVRNLNRSAVSCPADGRTYEVKGHLVGPRTVLRGTGRKAATIYLHGLGYGEFFWRFPQAPEYDYAARQADAGRVSLVLDRLGYGASGRPDGDEVCYGSEADYVSQIAQQLRAGTYTARGPAPRFDRLALAGHSAGGFMVETAATSFGGIDALVVLAFGNTGASPTALSTFFQTQLTCQSGMAEGGYTFFGATEQDFRAAHLNTVEPRIADLVAARRAKDPCGDTGAAAQTIATDVARNNEVRVPVLVVTGSEDVLFPPPAGPNEAALFSGSPDVTQVTVEGGHALTFNRSAPQFRKVVADWLARRGL